MMALPPPNDQVCFSTDEFLDKDFQVDEFVSRCRKRVTMEGLREDLDGYFRTLKSAMVELINKDYADFVNLSANLVGMDKSIGNLMSPLQQLQTEILDIKTAMEEATESVEKKLALKAEIREHKITLRRLITTLESIDKLERLLHVHTSEPSNVASEIHQLTQRSEWGPVVMERVAMEFNKLQYNASKIDSHPLIDECNERIRLITRALQSQLESSFRAGLETEDRATLTSCLQTYALIGHQEAAEAMFSVNVVHPYMEKVVTTKNLFAHPQGLPGIFADILDFIPKYCSLLMELTSRGGLSEGEEHAHILKGFDFLVNAVWPDVVTLIEQKASLIFAPGDPNAFHKNYNTSMEFVSSFETHCSCEESVRRLRAHPTYTAFMSKWSLPVYFQIRFQEIAGPLEGSLTLPLEESSGESMTPTQPIFKLQLFQSLWVAVARCWSEGVFIDALVHRFWKLTLQLLMRAAQWMSDLSTETLPEECSTTQTTTPLPVKTDNEKASGTSVLSVHECLMAISDCEEIGKQIQGAFANLILPRLPNQHPDLLQGGLKDATVKLQQLVPKFAAVIVEKVVKQCSRSIDSAHAIPRLYRRTNKGAPSKASTFVSSILRPLEETTGEFPHKYRKDWTMNIIESITENYYKVTSELLMSVKRTEDSLLKLKAYRKSLAPTPTSGMSDDNKIRLQLALDIESYSAQLARLDAKALQRSVVKQLLEMGQTSKNTALGSTLET